MEEDVELADRFLAAYWRTSPVELDDHQNINVKITITPTIVSQFKKKKGSVTISNCSRVCFSFVQSWLAIINSGFKLKKILLTRFPLRYLELLGPRSSSQLQWHRRLAFGIQSENGLTRRGPKPLFTLSKLSKHPF